MRPGSSRQQAFLGKEFVVFDYVPVWGSGKFLIASPFSTTVDGILAKYILPYRSYSKAYFSVFVRQKITISGIQSMVEIPNSQKEKKRKPKCKVNNKCLKIKMEELKSRSKMEE